MKKICSKRNIKIINWVLVFASILIFEFGYCNAEYTIAMFTKNPLQSYNFTICRGVVYIVILISIYCINKSKIIDEVSNSYNNKTKRIILIIDIIIEMLIFIFYLYKFLIKKEIVLIQFSLVSIMLISAFLAIENITNKYFTNIISIFLIGVIFCITVNCYHVLDENAYNVSYGNINFNDPVIDKQFMEDLPRGTHYSQLVEFFKVKYDFKKGSLPEESTVDSTPAGYNPIIYIPSAIGILFGRLLQGSVADIFIMGRLFNLLTYFALITLTIKILPYKKNTFLMIMSIPIILCFSATYSIDGIGIGIVSLFIAYCLKLYKKKDRIIFKDLIILAIIYTFMLTFKSMSYIFVGVLIFLLPIKKIFKEHYKKLIPLIILFIIINIAIFSIQPKINLTDNRYESIDASEQIKIILNNPLFFITVMKNHIKNTLLNWNWIKDFNAPDYLSTNADNIFIIMFIYYLYIAFKDDCKNFNLKEKIIFLMAFALTYSFTSGILYIGCTNVGAFEIAGYQLRYIFPIISLLLIVLSNKTLKQNNDKNFLMKMTSFQIMFISLALIGAIFK